MPSTPAKLEISYAALKDAFTGNWGKVYWRVISGDHIDACASAGGVLLCCTITDEGEKTEFATLRSSGNEITSANPDDGFLKAVLNPLS